MQHLKLVIAARIEDLRRRPDVFGCRVPFIGPVVVCFLRGQAPDRITVAVNTGLATGVGGLHTEFHLVVAVGPETVAPIGRHLQPTRESFTVVVARARRGLKVAAETGQQCHRVRIVDAVLCRIRRQVADQRAIDTGELLLRKASTQQHPQIEEIDRLDRLELCINICRGLDCNIGIGGCCHGRADAGWHTHRARNQDSTTAGQISVEVCHRSCEHQRSSP